jgi:hypothetical protein
VLTDCSFTDSSANKLNAITINTNKTQTELASEFSSWQGLDLKFNDDLTGNTATLKFSITNNATSGSEEYIFASVSVSQGTSTNASVSVSPSSQYIDPQQKVEYTITFTITDTTANASLSGFAITFNLERQTEKISGYTVEWEISRFTEEFSDFYSAILTVWKNDGTTEEMTAYKSYTINNVVKIQISFKLISSDGLDGVRVGYDVSILKVEDHVILDTINAFSGTLSKDDTVTTYSDIYEVTQNGEFVFGLFSEE